MNILKLKNSFWFYIMVCLQIYELHFNVWLNIEERLYKDEIILMSNKYSLFIK